MEDYKFLFKIVLIGNSGVGKTCLVQRFAEDCFPPGECSTIGVDFKIRSVQMEGDVCKLQIWDTAGQERFRSITYSYYRNASAIIVVYDITKADSFDSVTDWLVDIERYGNHQVPVYLVGNKCDKQSSREVSRTTGEEYARLNNIEFIETSAKSSDNVDDLFKNITARLREEELKKRSHASPVMTTSFRLEKNNTSEVRSSSWCCFTG